MKRWLFRISAALCLLACVALMSAWIVSCSRGFDASVEFPRGVQTSVRGAGGRARLVFTRWGVESPQWWRARPGNGPMTVTGRTVTFSGGNTLVYAAQINVDFGSSQWHGLEWRSGAVSRNPVVRAAGVMSTPLVPYRSLTLPWYYPLPVLLPLPAVWIWSLLRRRRRGPGLCPHCGYDLRATPDRCPECGRQTENI